ncbi:MAG: BlaI/MecI/CopY family transcriptional regulator [Chloroflexi bacterium]|nr:BlaI/MecI/CopY family transcriptional regulator [Chloroflexota bacterium]
MMTPDPEISVYRPDRPGIRKVLGDLEAEIMEYIWQHPAEQGTTVREVFEALYARRRIAYTTVMSTMARLAKKQLLRSDKADAAYVYYPNFTQEQFVSRLVGRILEDLLVGFAQPALPHLPSLADPQAAERMRRLLEEITLRREAEGEEEVRG